jgi:hypothetical protein
LSRGRSLLSLSLSVVEGLSDDGIAVERDRRGKHHVSLLAALITLSVGIEIVDGSHC